MIRKLVKAARGNAILAAAALLSASTPALSAAQSPYEVTVITEAGPETIPISEFSGKAMVPLRPIAALLDGALRPGSERSRVTLTASGSQAQLSDGKEFVPVKGKMELLSSPVRLVSGEWYVPLDFLSKIVPALSSVTVSYRPQERWLVVGDGFPRLDVRSRRDPTYTRVELATSRPVPLEVEQSAGTVHVTLRTPYLQTDFQDEELLDGVVESVSLARTERGYRLTVRLGERFGTLKAYELPEPSHGMVLDLVRSRVPERRTTATRYEPEIIDEDLRPMSERGDPLDPDAEARAGERSEPDLDPGLDPDLGELALVPETITLAPDYPLPSSGSREPMTGPEGPPRLRTVTLDPGHGGAQVGATGPGGHEEKTIVLSIARRLQRRLSERLGLRVLLTRDGDRSFGHDERAAIANNNKSDLFISIHADASPRSSARGSSVYFLSYGSETASQASAGNGRGGGSELDFILWDMAQAAYLSRSSRLAEILQGELLAATGTRKGDRGIKQNAFRVLRGTAMPAVLVEVGFISNAEEERLLATAEYQETIAEALYRGIVRFKDLYESRGSEGAFRSRE